MRKFLQKFFGKFFSNKKIEKGWLILVDADFLAAKVNVKGSFQIEYAQSFEVDWFTYLLQCWISPKLPYVDEQEIASVFRRALAIATPHSAVTQSEIERNDLSKVLPAVLAELNSGRKFTDVTILTITVRHLMVRSPHHK